MTERLRGSRTLCTGGREREGGREGGGREGGREGREGGKKGGSDKQMREGGRD